MAIELTDDMDSVSTTIQGGIFPVRMPYSEGHTCDDVEAHTLNQTRRENLRNNFAPKIAKACEKHQIDDKDDEGNEIKRAALFSELPDKVKEELYAEFRGYEDAYEFYKGAGREADPVKSQAKQLAVAAVRKRLKEQGHNLTEIGNEKISELALQAIERNPAFMQQAQSIVDARKAADAALSVDLA